MIQYAKEVILVSRIAREISESRLYHIVFRGVNRQRIFEEEADYERIIEILIELKNEMDKRGRTFFVKG